MKTILTLDQAEAWMVEHYDGQQLADALETLRFAASEGATAWSKAELGDIADNTP